MMPAVTSHRMIIRDVRMVMQRGAWRRRRPPASGQNGRDDPGSAPTKGRLLLATPPLEDPNFDRTVIYVLEHHDEGALGAGAQPAQPRGARRAARRLGRPADATRRWCSSAARSSPTR